LGRSWPALEISLSSGDSALRDRLLAALDDFQPTALEEPDDASRLSAYFTSSRLRDDAAHAVKASFGDRVSVEARDVPDDNWAERSQASLGAVTVGALVVAPPWQADGYRDSHSHLIVIRPSMGFGTGHHATTRLTLEALQQVDLRGKTMLDIGCGSGVLALAAVTLGAASAVGIDIDPDALANATDNLELNGLSGSVRFEAGDFRQLSNVADVVAANLTGALLAGAARELGAVVKPGGHLIISGFMEHEKSTVQQALEPLLMFERIAQEGEWLCATYKSRQM
jgi:ribosomal protein L11 methyltransferase